MISLYGVLILLLTAGTIHAQGNTNDGDGVNVDQASISKDATSLPQRVHSLGLRKALQESDTPDQSSISSSVDLQPGEECTGGHGIRKVSKSCSQQQSLPVSQSSTSHDPPQSDEMSLPVYLGKSEVESYSQSWNTEQYRRFIMGEARYFGSTYFTVKILGGGSFGMVYLATKKSNGLKVVYKAISNLKIHPYALESSPPPRFYIPNTLNRHKKQSVAQCMPPRPPNLMVPHELLLQMYLSRPGHENPYVPKALDYFILEDEYILVMEYLDEKWVSLSRYLREKTQLDIETARDILREIVNAMMFLKRQGVVHNDIHAGNVMYNTEEGTVKLIDFGISDVFQGWTDGKSFPLKHLDSSSTALEYKARIKELRSMQRIGQLLSNLLTGKRGHDTHFKYGALMRKTILPDPDSSKSVLKEKAIHLVNILVSLDMNRMPSIETILKHPFFD
ncbi:hypothetical protein BASA50_004141 [Batrachochytrium salamandrivorans]|uniref:non-specific serine/threonine protein kinase n=2 Tax=Batrachochytrium salamandrivorans TaxID=1357716 RepID=A0ABQ8FGS0_9FUNG|nr:hypothetical protein BASA50_004141 [Batrachochytrium salamandrivorans]